MQNYWRRTAIFLGFDSESKPTFRVGRRVHIWFSLPQNIKPIYLFIDFKVFAAYFVKPSANCFGLKNDKHIFHKKGIELALTLLKVLVTLVLLSKWVSRSTVVWTVSFKVKENWNWAQKPLTPQQISYAAADQLYWYF